MSSETVPLLPVSCGSDPSVAGRKSRIRSWICVPQKIRVMGAWQLIPLVLVGVVLVVSSGGGAGGRATEDPLISCLQDPDYEQLVDIVDTGLPPARTPRHIAIIGGGMAGLTAAKVLEDAGHTVTIVEASGRLGGRVETFRDRADGWYAELGAMRIPSFNRILLSFASKLNISLSPFVQNDNNTFYLINGALHTTQSVEQHPGLLNYSLRQGERGRSAAQLFTQSLSKVKQDLRLMGCEAMLQKYDSYSVKEYLLEEGDLSRGALRMIGDLLNENALFYTSLIETLYIQMDISDSNQYFEVTGGFDHLPRTFHRLLDATVLLNSRVKHIDQTDGSKVTVVYRASNGSLRNLTADYALVTTTAKAALLIDFQPALSRDKMEALRSVHYADATKVILSFSRRFWEQEGISGGKSITDRPSRFIVYPSHSFPGTDAGALLGSYTASDDAALFAGLSDQEAVAVALRDLVLIHGEGIRHLFTGGLVKRWGQDPHSLGAFVVFTPYQRGHYSSQLSRSEGRLYFAGEHTAFPHGWIDTAMMSALRAARDINLLTL